MFLIRRIIEAALHIKALREGKHDHYKDSNGEVKDLKYIPDIAKDLGFISRYHAKDLNTLVQKQTIIFIITGNQNQMKMISVAILIISVKS